MLRSGKIAWFCVLLTLLGPALMYAQDDSNETPLGDVARNLRKKSPSSRQVIDDDNLTKVMDDADNRRPESSTLKYLMAGESKNFLVSSPDVTCSLSFSANAKSLLSSQYSQMELPPGEVLKLAGPATIEGDALTVAVRNGTSWHLSEIAVALTVIKKKSGLPVAGESGPVPNGLAESPLESVVRPEKKPDITVIYRMRAGAPPAMTTVFSARLDAVISADDEWHWAIVQAKGYPPQNYVASVPAAPERVSDGEVTPRAPSSLGAPSPEATTAPSTQDPQ